MSEKKESFIPLIYIGRRSGEGNKTLYTFLNTNTERTCCWIGRISGVWIGATYKGSGEDGKEKIARKPERVWDAPKPDDEQLEQWQAQEDAFEAKLKAKRAEEKIKKTFTERKYKAALEPLYKVVRKLDMFEQRAFVEFVVYESRKRK